MNRGLFLDFDGTLADSLGPLQQVCSQFLKQLGRSLGPDEFEQFNGIPFSRLIQTLRQKYNLEDPVDVLEIQYQTAIHKAYEDVGPVHGASELLQRAKDDNFILACVTSGSHLQVSQWLRRHDLVNYFEAIIGYEHTAAGKPSPDPYQLALKKCRCRPEDSYAVEDSVPGFLSASAAGLKVFVLSHGKIDWHSASLPRRPYQVVRSLNEIEDCFT